MEKKQDEGGRKAVAELGVLFGPKRGGCWCGPVQCECQLSTWVGTRVHVQAEGWVGWPHPPALWSHPVHFSCCRKARSPWCHSVGLSR